MKRTSWKGESVYPSAELAALVATGLIETSGRVLEVGCGLASDALYLSSLGAHVDAIDLDPAGLRIARARATRLDLHLHVTEADATEPLPFADRSFDLVLDRLCWNNLTDAERLAYVAELARVCEDGAWVVVRAKERDRLPVREALAPPDWNLLSSARDRARIDRWFRPLGPPVRLALAGDGDRVHGVMAILVRRGRKRARR